MKGAYTIKIIQTKMMKCILLFTIIFSTITFSQNLISNGSFEKLNTDCVRDVSQLTHVVDSWMSPTNGTPDTFNKCYDELEKKYYLDSYTNHFGTQKPNDGNNYVGNYLFAPGNYREYLLGVLVGKLKKDEKYIFNLNLSLAEISNNILTEFQVVFLSDKIKLYHEKVIDFKDLKKKNIEYRILTFKSDEGFNDKNDWMKCSQNFEALGFEKYFIIGNFNSNSKSKTIKTTSEFSKSVAYYYFDDMSLNCLNNNVEQISEKEIEVDEEFSFDVKYKMKHILFDFDKTIINEKGKNEIKRIAEFINSNKNIYINIVGHTDNFGSKEYNKKLSCSRANEVAVILMSLGVPQKQISVSGNADEFPISSNESEEGRAMNRRVEFEFKKNINN